MSSNVGTGAFKSPEFFRRNHLKKISYHRNVDVNASGLTFLSMLQADIETRMLIPQRAPKRRKRTKMEGSRVEVIYDRSGGTTLPAHRRGTKKNRGATLSKDHQSRSLDQFLR
jgi:hypothetical protein